MRKFDCEGLRLLLDRHIEATGAKPTVTVELAPRVFDDTFADRFSTLNWYNTRGTPMQLEVLGVTYVRKVR